MNQFVEKIAVLFNKGRYDTETHSQTITGRSLHLLVSTTIPAGFEDSWARIYSSVFDNTERVFMEAERHRVQKQMQSARQIQAIATLAGGIAHKFNNSLGVILGNLGLLELRFGKEDEVQQYLPALKASTEKMGQLTEQLLAYARGGKYQPLEFSLNDLIQNIISAPKVALPPSVNMTTEFSPDLFATYISRSIQGHPEIVSNRIAFT